MFILGHVWDLFSPSCFEGDNCYLYGAVSVTIQGVSFAIFSSAVWGIIPWVTNPNITGTAFGLAYSFLNIGLSISPYLAGCIYDSYGFYWESGWFVGLGVVCLLLVSWLQAENMGEYGGDLDRCGREIYGEELREGLLSGKNKVIIDF